MNGPQTTADGKTSLQTDFFSSLLKYISAVKTYLSTQMEEPSGSFVKAVASEVHDGRITAQVRTTVAGAIKTAFNRLLKNPASTRI